MKQVLYVGDRDNPEHFYALGYEMRNFTPERVEHLGHVSLRYLKFLRESNDAPEGPVLVNANGCVLNFDDNGEVTDVASSDIGEVYGWDSPTGELAKVLGTDDHTLGYAIVWNREGLPGLVRPYEQAFLGTRDSDGNFIHVVSALYDDIDN